MQPRNIFIFLCLKKSVKVTLERAECLQPGPLLLPHQGYREDCVIVSLELVLAVMNLVVHGLYNVWYVHQSV